MNDNDKKEIINLIDNLNAISFYELNEHSKECYYEIRNAILAMSTDASQEPCEDAISRQVALASIKDLYPDMPVMDIMGAKRKWLKKYAPYIECENAIERLPLITPQQKMGQWIKTISENGITSAVRCSKCGFEDNRYMLFRYCPNCGHCMIEPNGSEDKDG